MIYIKNFIRKIFARLRENIRKSNKREDEEIKRYVDVLYEEDRFNKSLFGIHQGRRW